MKAFPCAVEPTKLWSKSYSRYYRLLQLTNLLANCYYFRPLYPKSTEAPELVNPRQCMGDVVKGAVVVALAICAFVSPSLAQVPNAGHVFIVVEENTNYSDVIGSSSMPYLNSLATQYGLATQYYANTHPSIGNYFMLTTGQILTNNDSQTPSSFPVSADNVVRELLGAGKTWKAYEESLPSACYLGGNTGEYAARHDPLAYMTDVQNSSVQCQNIVPFSQFAADLTNNQLPDYSFITPNLCDDAHDCSLTTADNWLQANIAPLIASSIFQTDGILVITFDESGSDNTSGGGRVPWIVVSPMAKKGYTSTTLYQHQSTLRMMLAALGVTTFPGAAASAPDMSEFFGASSVAVSISPTSVTVASGGTQPFSATVSNASNTSVTWSATGGTISSSGLYTAPTVTSNTTATVTATSVADATKWASATVSITANAVTVSISPTSATLGSGGTQQFSAAVSNTSNTSVTWSATAGTVSSSGLYTAPTVTSNTTATVTATSAADPTKSASATVSVSAAVPPSCSLSISPSSGAAPLSVTADGACSDPSSAIVTVSLTWGDGTSQSTTTGTHTYTKQGSYQIIVTATDAASQSTSVSQTVKVNKRRVKGALARTAFSERTRNQRTRNEQW
jgi:hypothetical protein